MAKKVKKTVQEVITDFFIKKLEEGTAPWNKPWSATWGGILPCNFTTKRPYKGINALITAASPFDSPYWMTRAQVKKAGGSIDFKEHMFTPIVYWLWSWAIKNDSGKWVKVEEGTAGAQKFGRPLFSQAYNAEQIDGIEFPTVTPLDPKDNKPDAKAEDLWGNWEDAPSVRFGGNRCYYTPSIDRINMVSIDMFDSAEEFYNTQFHEGIHATGHKSRLNRESLVKNTSFGSERYSKEELVAEIGASFLSNYAGFSSEKLIENSAAYINGWIKSLKKDPKLIISASSQARKAVDHILGSGWDEAPSAATSSKSENLIKA